MATSFEEIYDVFLSNINDDIFLQSDEDNDLKLRYLKNSIPKFSKCQADLSKRTEVAFIEDLTSEEIIILGTLMLLEYFNSQIFSLENIKQSISNKDFNMTSQANFLQSLLMLRTAKRSEVNKLIIDYTYNNGNIKALR